MLQRLRRLAWQFLGPPPYPEAAPRTTSPSCRKCDDTGVIETGNNDLPCDCPLGDKAVFNDAVYGQVSGAELKRKLAHIKRRLGLR